MTKLLRNKWFWIVLGVIVVGLSFVGTMSARRGKVQSITVATAKKRDVVQKVKAPGIIEPRTIVNISADIPGKVVTLAVREGDSVKKGQLLLELDNTQYVSSTRQSQAALSAANARFRQAQARWKIAQSTFERRKALFDRKLLSRSEMDTAESDYDAARTEVEAAREEVSRLQAALRGARDNLSKTTYRSPIDGTVVSLNIEAGEIVVTGTMNNPGTQILAVADISRMLVKADVDETDVVDVRVGQTASIEVDAVPDTMFKGTVTEVGNSASRQGAGTEGGETNFEVKVLFDETVPAVRPGMTADVEIEVRRAVQTVAIPIQAVIVRQPEELEERAKGRGKRGRTDKGQALASADVEEELDPKARRKREVSGVFILVDGKARFRRVVTGISSETEIQVRAGDLKAGDKVITGPYKVLRDLRPGDAVKIQQKRGPAAGSKR